MTREELDALMVGDIDDINETELEGTIDNKIVFQVDDVTKDSEGRAEEVFDTLESINNFLQDAQDNASEVINLIDSNIELFETLCKKFPNVEQFSKSLEDNKTMKEKVEALIGSSQSAEDEIVQYQDMNKEKIQRVSNVMRALSGYMSSLFEGKAGDKNREDLEKIIASLGEK